MLSYFAGAQNQPQNPFFFFIVDNQPYQTLENSISLTQGIPYDDPSYLVPLGFEFEYLGDFYDSLVFAGIDSYGAELAFFKSVPGYPVHLISPYMMDIIDGQINGSKADSDIRYWVDGEVGNRVFYLEWSNVGFYNEGDPYSMRMNFMMRLYEGTNAIEFHYGSRTELDHNIITDYEGVPVVFTKNVDENEQSIESMQALSGNPSNPTLLEYTNVGDFIMGEQLVETPFENTVYRFNPLFINTNETDENEIKTYPNPANEKLYVQIDQPGLVTLWNATGQKVYESFFTQGLNEVDVAALPTGLYFLKKVNEEKELVKKLIIN